MQLSVINKTTIAEATGRVSLRPDSSVLPASN
jgi:hypothetical protein